MKPLRIKKHTNDGDTAATPQGGTTTCASVAIAPSSVSASPRADPHNNSASSEPSTLVSSPPSSPKGGGKHLSVPPHSSSSASSSNPQHGKADDHAGVRFSSELDNANVEAYLEYLTRPHTSWDSATRHIAHRRKVIENHRASVFARSLASSRHASFASSMRSESTLSGCDGDVLEMSNATSSLAAAPAGFPRSASNASKTRTGKLRKGRLGDANTVPVPSDLVATGSGASSGFMPNSSGGLNENNNASRTTSEYSSASTKQRAPTIKGRLSRGGTLSGPQAKRASTASSASAAATPSAPGPDLTIGGTRLQTGCNNLFVGGVLISSAGARSASRDGSLVPKDAKGKLKGI